MRLTRQPHVNSWVEAVAPPETTVRLSLTTVGTISGAAAAIVKRWIPNSAYTPEVGGGSAATKGFSNWAGIYAFYRVVSYKYDIFVCNNEAFPVSVYVMNLNDDPGTTANSTTAQNSLSQIRLLSAKGGQDRCRFRGTYTIARVIGSNSAEFDDDYRASVTASPSDVTWLCVGVQSTTGVNVTNGIGYEFNMSQITRFYDRKTQ